MVWVMRARRYVWFVGVVVLAACVMSPAMRVWGHFAYRRDQRVAMESVRQLRDQRPRDVDADTWEMASGWAITAYCNVCFSPEHVSHDELRRFRVDLEEQLRRPVDLSTIDWVWERLGQTGPHGARYRERFEPQYREELEAVRSRR